MGYQAILRHAQGVRGLTALASLLLASLILSACVGPTTQRADLDPDAVAREAAKQRELALHDRMAQAARLDDVGFAVLTRAVPLCGEDVAPFLGIRVHNKYSYEKDWQTTARALFGTGERLRLSHVTAGSPAAAAGLKTGDIIHGIDGVELRGKHASDTLLRAISKHLSDGPTVINLRIAGPDGSQRTVSLAPVLACNYGLHLALDNSINAYADGENIVLHTGMMNFARNDTELATVVAHELAHNAMGHMDALTANAAGGLVLDVLALLVGVNTQGAFSKIASQAYSVEFEAEADYVGVYALALAGMDINRSPDLWRRMAVRNPGAIDYTTSHPTAPARFIGMEEAVAEVQRKIAAGDALRPEIRTSTAADSGPDGGNPYRSARDN